MLVGADVTHPPPGDRRDSSPSIAGVVGSVDLLLTKYKGLVSVQHPNEEIIQNLYNKDKDPQNIGMITELLYAFEWENHELPQRVIFYRDGISEGQFKDVLRVEVRAIKEAFASFRKDYQPQLTLKVVQKRHHTRFFPDTLSGNISAGNESSNALLRTS